MTAFLAGCHCISCKNHIDLAFGTSTVYLIFFFIFFPLYSANLTTPLSSISQTIPSSLVANQTSLSNLDFSTSVALIIFSLFLFFSSNRHDLFSMCSPFRVHIHDLASDQFCVSWLQISISMSRNWLRAGRLGNRARTLSHINQQQRRGETSAGTERSQDGNKQKGFGFLDGFLDTHTPI